VLINDSGDNSPDNLLQDSNDVNFPMPVIEGRNLYSQDHSLMATKNKID